MSTGCHLPYTMETKRAHVDALMDETGEIWAVHVKPFDFLHSSTPRAFMRPLDAASRIAETVPLLREISGSLLVVAYK